jgi:hypothetical protein
MKALRKGLGDFMMQILDSRFAHHIMNMHRRLARHFMMWILCEMLAALLPSVFIMKNVNAHHFKKGE